MKIAPYKINIFLLFNLPLAFFAGVRVKSISEITCTTSVKHRWINQNPFKSIFWAVQGMAAELSTGALVMSCIKNSKADISMLVASNKASFLKKAKGRIIFACNDGDQIKQVIASTIANGEGQKCCVKSVGMDSSGDIVSIFEFEWTVKAKV